MTYNVFGVTLNLAQLKCSIICRSDRAKATHNCPLVAQLLRNRLMKDYTLWTEKNVEVHLTS